MIDRGPMARFERGYTGENVIRSLGVAERLLMRKNREQATSIELPERTDVHWDLRRKSKRTVNAGPNAPLLIRLVRYPYVMTGTSMTHSPLFRRDSLPERAPFGEVARRNADAWAKPSVNQPARGRIRLESPVRPSVSSWLVQRGSE